MMQMLRILGKRGRITIPFEIRQRVGFKYNKQLSCIDKYKKLKSPIER